MGIFSKIKKALGILKEVEPIAEVIAPPPVAKVIKEVSAIGDDSVVMEAAGKDAISRIKKLRRGYKQPKKDTGNVE